MIKTSPLARKLAAFVVLSNEDLSTLERPHQRRRRFVTGVDLVHQGQVNQAAYILAKGWVCSYKILPDGATARLSISRYRVIFSACARFVSRR